jgi:hypothetical protein
LAICDPNKDSNGAFIGAVMRRGLRERQRAEGVGFEPT